MNEREEYDRARQKVEARLGFYIHLGVYLLVNILLAAIDLLLSPETLWFYWPLLGWGIGVLAHAVAVFLPRRGQSLKQRWIERAARRELQRGRTSGT